MLKIILISLFSLSISTSVFAHDKKEHINCSNHVKSMTKNEQMNCSKYIKPITINKQMKSVDPKETDELF
ncbi:hypothetical protein C9J21_18585 [Photobacterium phosphoreum]|nr:hypothetical protein C9J21_18585 [Photobacterium phosphoreum]